MIDTPAAISVEAKKLQGADDRHRHAAVVEHLDDEGLTEQEARAVAWAGVTRGHDGKGWGGHAASALADAAFTSASAVTFPPDAVMIATIVSRVMFC